MKFFLTLALAFLATIATAVPPLPTPLPPKLNAVATAADRDNIPKEIAVGETTDNAETSRAVDLIIRRCAEAYRLHEFTAQGALIYSSKFDEEEDIYSKGVSLLWKGPDKLFIETTSGTQSSIFNADGRHFTFISDQGQQYLQLPQSVGLPAFSENHRAGELLQDFSGTIGEATVAPLLFTPDPLNWLHTNVKRYVYEGEEDVQGAKCWRIKFVQEHPEITVINWVDQSNFLLRKNSIIRSFNDDGDAIESYADGYIASMQIMIWDKIDTRSGRLRAKDFTVNIPSSYTEMTTSTIAESTESFWDSLLRIASADTTVTHPRIARSAGELDFDFQAIVRVGSDIGAIDVMPRTPGQPAGFLMALKGKGLAVASLDGTTSSVLSADEEFVLCQAVGARDDLVLLAAGRDRSKLAAYDLAGNHRWTYQLPRGTLLSLKTGGDPTSPSIYVLFEESDGIRRLALDGTLLHATRAQSDAAALVYGNNSVFAINDEAVWAYTDDLRTSSIHDIENQPGPITWAKGAKDPILCIARNPDEEIVLQNWSVTGEIQWSTTIAEEGDVIDSGAVTTALLRIDDKPTTCVAVVVDTGIIIVTDLNGRLLYKARVTADDTALRRTGNVVVANLHATDTDNDGIDELYTVSDRQVIQLKQK